MRTAVSKPMWATFVVLGAVGATLGIAVRGGVQSRGALLSQLERPAGMITASVGPGPVDDVLRSGPWTVRLGVTPNAASLRDRVTLRISHGGHALNAATVTATYSMPSMDMWAGLRTRLAPSGSGGYAATEPVLGMPGAWRLSLTVAPRGGRAFTIVVDDRMNP